MPVATKESTVIDGPEQRTQFYQEHFERRLAQIDRLEDEADEHEADVDE